MTLDPPTSEPDHELEVVESELVMSHLPIVLALELARTIALIVIAIALVVIA